MLKLLYILPFLSFAQVGINILPPDLDMSVVLDVNGEARFRQLQNKNTDSIAVFDGDGKLGYKLAATSGTPTVIKDNFNYSQGRDVFMVQSATGFFSENDIPNFTLSKSLTITIPANTTKKLELYYNIPIIVGYSGSDPAGYWGIGVLKNGVAFAAPGRKTNYQTVKPSPNSYYECYHVIGGTIDEISNPNSTDLTVTYQFYLYIEQTLANYAYPIYVGKWAISEFHPNYNHGFGYGFVKEW